MKTLSEIRSKAQALKVMRRVENSRSFRYGEKHGQVKNLMPHAQLPSGKEGYPDYHDTPIHHELPVKDLKSRQHAVSAGKVMMKIREPDDNPIDVMKVHKKDGTHEWHVLDGNHRLHAAKALGQSKIKAKETAYFHEK